MFTGIVRARGRVIEPPRPSGRGGERLVLGLPSELAAELALGSSLAVAGACLTVVELDADRCAVELSPETLQRTRLGGLAAGDEVNLEPPLKAGEPLGGHWVQGHVDATTGVTGRRETGEHRLLRCELPGDLAAFLVEKGSVALDGVSLTVAARGGDWFEVALIPHTLEVTTLARAVAGDRLHLEVDILAKYVHQALAAAGRLSP